MGTATFPESRVDSNGLKSVCRQRLSVQWSGPLRRGRRGASGTARRFGMECTMQPHGRPRKSGWKTSDHVASLRRAQCNQVTGSPLGSLPDLALRSGRMEQRDRDYLLDPITMIRTASLVQYDPVGTSPLTPYPRWEKLPLNLNQ